jgi:hypothetical protein
MISIVDVKRCDSSAVTDSLFCRGKGVRLLAQYPLIVVQPMAIPHQRYCSLCEISITKSRPDSSLSLCAPIPRFSPPSTIHGRR